MIEITKDATHRIYDLAKSVHEGEVKKSVAADEADRDKLMSRGSALSYIKTYRCMLEATVYKWAINKYSTKYFLEKIREDSGEHAYSNAIKSCLLHLDYYEETGKGRQAWTHKHVEGLAIRAGIIANTRLYPDEIDNKATYHEGAKKTVAVNSYERNRKARTACLDYFGETCRVCEMDFGEFYGAIGEGFIHVHHKKDLSLISGPYEVDPINDLIPVCPNCHAMLHQETPAMTVEELRRRIQDANT